MEQKLSPNFTAGAGMFKPSGFIIHGTLGKYEGAIDWLCTPPEKRTPQSWSSAHAVIAKDGRITELVKPIDIAWHAGTVQNPTAYATQFLKTEVAGGVKKFINPNKYLIGLENEWFDADRDSTQQLTEKQLDAIAKYIFDTGIKNPVILLHSEITDYKADFRKRDGAQDTGIRDAIVKRLAQLNNPVQAVTTPVQQPSASDPQTILKAIIKTKTAELAALVNQLS